MTIFVLFYSSGREGQAVFAGTRERSAASRTTQLGVVWKIFLKKVWSADVHECRCLSAKLLKPCRSCLKNICKTHGQVWVLEEEEVGEPKWNWSTHLRKIKERAWRTRRPVFCECGLWVMNQPTRVCFAQAQSFSELAVLRCGRQCATKAEVSLIVSFAGRTELKFCEACSSFWSFVLVLLFSLASFVRSSAQEAGFSQGEIGCVKKWPTLKSSCVWHSVQRRSKWQPQKRYLTLKKIHRRYEAYFVIFIRGCGTGSKDPLAFSLEYTPIESEMMSFLNTHVVVHGDLLGLLVYCFHERLAKFRALAQQHRSTRLAPKYSFFLRWHTHLLRHSNKSWSQNIGWYHTLMC